MSVYSFVDVSAAIVGPGGSINLGMGAATSEEGISIESSEDKNVMTIGADGSVMHSLIAAEAANVSIKLLKTSPTNAALQNLYNFQTSSSLYHGKNTITIRNPITGDSITLSEVAFSKRPAITYAKEGGMIEWAMHCGKTTQVLGVGTPSIF